MTDRSYAEVAPRYEEWERLTDTIDDLATLVVTTQREKALMGTMSRTYRDAATKSEAQRDYLRDALRRADARTVALVARGRWYRLFAALALCGAALGYITGGR